MRLNGALVLADLHVPDQIPKGHCWVVGDNLSYSRDSRIFGPLPMALIKGKVLASYKPWTDFKWLENGLQPATEEHVD